MSDDRAEGTGQLAGIHFRRDDDIDPLLDHVAAALARRGRAVRGLLPRYEPDPASPYPVMQVENIADGRRIQISQRLGPEATGCRLDPDGLARAAVAVDASLDPDTDILILNRFGRAEAEGGGLRGVIEHALDLGMPVLIAVRETYRDAWQQFHGGMAANLPHDENAVLQWCIDAVSTARPAAQQVCS